VENKTLTDKIYTELVDGLRTGLDWPHFLAKHGASKGPLYNAIGRFFNDMEPKVRALNEVQTRLDQAGLKLDSLDEKIKEAEGSLAPLEDRRNVLNEEIENLETKLAEKGELLEHAGELGKLGFDTERLKELQDALTQIGAKHGLKGKEAVSKFFTELKDYDTKIRFEREIQRLETITSTKRLEAEKWHAEADSLARRYKELSEAITAVQSLVKHGVRAEQIVSWNNALTSIGGVEELEKGLEKYESIQKLLLNKRSGIRVLEREKARLEGELKELREQKAQIEGSINAITESGIRQIQRAAQAAANQLKETGAEAQAEVGKYLARFDEVVEKAHEVGAKVGEAEERLRQLERVKEAIASHEATQEGR